ncbi:MAG: late competence development ComFB family protein [Clostridiaceae bacterium]|jgi:competence protein ComFB|nr:late competence development ComFB family protein [Clostridiaceae bacterium]
MRELRYKLYSSAGFENLTENLVFDELDDFIQKAKNKSSQQFCFCNICLADVAAIVLNELESFYCSNFIDKNKYQDYYKKHKIEVQRKIVKAFDLVKQNPHHADNIISSKERRN